MKKLNLLSRAEMKKVMGGIISPEAWHRMCLDGKFGGTGDTGGGTAQDEINKEICNAMFEEMQP